MPDSYKLLRPNHFLSTHVRLINDWRTRDVVTFSHLVDFTAIEAERDRRKRQGFQRPSYTAFIIDSIARALRDHPKLNRMVYRGLTGYRWVQFENVDIAVGVELVDGELDIAFSSLIRNADQIGIDGIHDALLHLATKPAESPQLERLRRFPPALTALLGRATGLHPSLWVRFRGGSCAVTSPGKYGVENITAKSAWPVQFAFGKVKQYPIVVDGQCVPRRAVALTMSWHRELTTGAVAARFLDQIVQQLAQESPAEVTSAHKHQFPNSFIDKP